jgi:hypothetical protein
MSNRNDLPSPSAPNFNQRLRETIQTYLGKQGDPLDRGLTLRDLIENGFATFKEGFNASSLSGGGGGGALPIAPVVVDGEVDLTPPPQPTGFTLSTAISHVFIEHDPPIYRQGRGHLRTHVYGTKVAAGAPLPTFSDAVEVGQFSGQVWAMPSDPATTWRLWIKWESNDGVLSPTPAGGTNGLEAITGQDVDAMVRAMTGEGRPFTVLPFPEVIDGVTYPAGIYSTNAFIMDLQVTRAKIANLAVDNSKIANLSASKITAGSIAVGQHIQSSNSVTGLTGWRINGNGTAEFAAASIRGQLIANQIDTRGLSIRDSSGNVILNAGSGDFTGSLNGTPASTVVNNANSAVNTANSAASAASSAQSTANSAISGLQNKLNSDSRNVLSGTGGIALGTLNWDSSGNRISGFGVGITRSGITAFNSSGLPTFSISGSTGNATFNGTVVASSGSIGGATIGANFVRSSNYIANSAGWSIGSDGSAEFNQITVRSGQVTGALLRITAIPRFYSGLYYEINAGAPVSTNSGPFYIPGQSLPFYLAWSGTMPAPETASHRIAAAVTVNSSNARGDADLITYIVANAGLSGTTITGEVVGLSAMSSQYGLSTTTAGASVNLYSSAVPIRVYVSAFHCRNTLTDISGMFWGVR